MEWGLIMTDTVTQTERRAVDGLRIALGVGGLIAFVLGLLVLFAPGSSAKIALTVTAVLLAIYAIIVGIVYIGASIFSRTQSGWARTGHILLGLLYVAAGIIMMMNLLATGVVVAVFIAITIGILWMLEGFFALSALGGSAASGGSKVWTVIYAIISIIAGITMMFSPLMGAAVLWLLLGISMVVLGVVQVVRAFSIKAE